MSIQKTIYGTYQVRWREGGRHLAETFGSKIEAVQFEAEKKLKARNPALFAVSSLAEAVSFSEFAAIWLRDYGAVYKKERSLILDRQHIRDYLGPRWGSQSIDSISKRDIAKLQGDLVEEGRLSAKSVNIIVGLAQKIFRTAVQWDYIRANPAQDVLPIKVPENDYDWWTFAARDRFLSWAKANDPELHAIIAFAINTGLRRGEIEGLLRDSIDFERRFIIVKRNYCSKTKTLYEHTKGKKIRRVPMNDLVFSILKERSMLPSLGQLFPADYDHLVERWFKPAQLEAFVDIITFHDLRHSFASHLAMSGVSVFDIQKLLGHADIKTTMRYMHLAPDHLSGITDLLLPKDNLLKNSKQRVL
jgi:integrase